MPVKQDLQKFTRELRRGIGQTLSKRQMLSYGKFAIDLIVRRTRKGLGVRRTGDPERPLRGLSQSYVRFRRQNRFRLDATTNPRKSNLTFTGQMLRSMRVKNVSDRLVRWGPDRRARRGGLTNEEVAERVSRLRPFNNLSAKEIDRLAKFVDDQLTKFVKDV